MATIYLNADTGDDSTGDGSSGSPYETYTKFCTEGSAGDTCHFQQATAKYTLGNHVCPVGSTMTATNYGDAVLDGTYPRLEGEGTMNVSNLIFDSMNTYHNSSTHGLFSPNQNSAATTWNIENCYVKNYGTNAGWRGQGPFNSHMHHSFTYFHVDNIQFNLTNCTVEVKQSDIYAYGNGTVFSGAQNTSIPNATVVNCIFVYEDGIYFMPDYGHAVEGTYTEVNAVHHDKDNLSHVDATHANYDFTSTYSCHYNFAGGVPSGTGNITTDPSFMSLGAYGSSLYSFQTDSPVIGAGAIQ